MEEFIVEQILKIIIDFFPSTDPSVLRTAYLPALKKIPELSPIVPPERARLVLARYFDYPEFYAGFVTRSFALLPFVSDLGVAIQLDSTLLRQKLGEFPDKFSVSSDSPLPVVTALSPEPLTEARYTYELQLDFVTNLYPLGATEEFGAAYWLCGFVVRSMLLAYYTDQIANRVGL